MCAGSGDRQSSGEKRVLLNTPRTLTTCSSQRMPKPSLDRATLLYGVLVAASSQMGADAWVMLDAA